MHISLIAAMSENGIIGDNNTLPWHLPDDLKYFKKVTSGKPVIMGRKTFESIGKPLPNRSNIILSQNVDFLAEGCQVVSNVQAALKAAGDCEEVMIIGGGKIYALFLPLATRLYLSIIHENYSGDTYFPGIDWNQWQLMHEEKREKFTTQVWEKRE